MAFDGGGSGSGGCALCSATAAAVSFTAGGRRVSHSATAELQSCRINGRCLCCAACCHPAMMMGNAGAAGKAGRTVMAPMGVEIVDPSSPEDGSVVSSADSQRTVSPFVVGDGSVMEGGATNGDMYSNGGGGQGGGGGGGHHHHRRQMSMRIDGVGSRSSSSCTVYNPLSPPAVPAPNVPTVLSPPAYSHQLPLNQQQQQPGPHQQQHHHHHYSHHYPYLRKMIIGEDEGELVEDCNVTEQQQLQTPTSTTGDLLMGLSDMDIPLVDGDEEDEEEDNCPLLEAEQLTSLQSNTTLTTSSTTAGDVTLLITVDDDGERGPS
ncbi:hypothetical protein TYRP_011371, partial [Tyrophagus putrescentiae]